MSYDVMTQALMRLLQDRLADKVADLTPSITTCALIFARENLDEFIASVDEANDDKIDTAERGFIMIALDLLCAAGYSASERNGDDLGKRRMSKESERETSMVPPQDQEER